MRRLNRRHVNEDKSISYIPTTTISVTFLGTGLPKELLFFGLSCPVQPYRLPVVHCFKCSLYTKKFCRGKKRCISCNHESADHTGYNTCVCIHCNSKEHVDTRKECLEYSRQKLFRTK